VFKTSDGYHCRHHFDSEWQGFCKFPVIPSLPGIPLRDAIGALRQYHRADQQDGRVIAQHTTAEWLERLDAADVPCAPILRRGEIIHNEQVVARDIIAEFDQPMVGRVRQPKPAARFQVNEAAIGGPAPRVGGHSHEVLRELGYSDGAIERMIADKAVRMADRRTEDRIFRPTPHGPCSRRNVGSGAAGSPAFA
jgi:crotonobetainyl-CoA:carnitine CoA-transferase CaiB-like acyl-CoA transferase